MGAVVAQLSTSAAVAAAFLSTLLKVAVRAGTFLVVAPALGPSGQALIALTSAWAAALVLVVIFGLPVRALREIGRNRQGLATLVGSDARLMGVLSLLYAGLGVVAGPLLFPAAEWIVWGLIALATVLNAYGDYLVACLRAVNRFGRDLVLSAFSGVTHFGLLAFAIWQSPTVTSVALAVLLSRGLYLAGAVALYRSLPELKESAGGPLKRIGTTARESTGFAMDAALATLFSQIDMLVLGFILAREQLGLYSAGSRLVLLILTVPPVLQSVLIPRLSRASEQGGFARLVDGFALGMLGLAAGSIAFILLFGDAVVKALLGDAFAGVSLLWPAFCLLILARTYESYVGILLYSLGLVRVRVASVAVGIVLVLSVGTAAGLYGEARGFICAFALAYAAVGAYGAYRLQAHAAMAGHRASSALAFGAVAVAAALALAWT